MDGTPNFLGDKGICINALQKASPQLTTFSEFALISIPLLAVEGFLYFGSIFRNQFDFSKSVVSPTIQPHQQFLTTPSGMSYGAPGGT